ncbi:hypothetical protein BVG81_003090 [Haliangium sp. UPWRP_2]|nr:hypothetical protein BVG81_003090 [Haliangium sp. UPWRP_2]
MGVPAASPLLPPRAVLLVTVTPIRLSSPLTYTAPPAPMPPPPVHWAVALLPPLACPLRRVTFFSASLPACFGGNVAPATKNRRISGAPVLRSMIAPCCVPSMVMSLAMAGRAVGPYQ